jgi:hypothetical protein
MINVTIAQISVLVALVNNSKKVALTPEQVTEVKSAMPQICMKYATGEAITEDENVILQFVTSLTKKAVTTAKGEAESESAKKAAEAAFIVALQDHKVKVNEMLTTFLAALNDEVKKAKQAKDFLFSNKSDIGSYFSTFLSTLPVEPKKPGTAKKGESKAHESNGTTIAKKHMTDVTKLQDGSFYKFIWDALTNANAKGLTKGEIEVLINANNSKKELTTADVKVALYKALYFLPEYKKGEKLFCSAEFANVVEETTK